MKVVYAERMNLTDLDVIECGTQQCKPGYTVGPAVRDFYLLHYVNNGSGVFETRGKRYYLSKGESFLVCPNVLTSYSADQHDPWNYSWVGFSGTKAETYLGWLNLNIENPILKYNAKGIPGDCYLRMMSADNLNSNKEIKLLSELYMLFSYYLEEAHNTSNNNKILSIDYVNKAAEFIETNYAKKLTITGIAQHIGLDSKYLSTLFKRQMDLSPYQFLIQTRIDKACELMRDHSLLIGDIARSVGYEDPLLFSKMFRKYKGYSPSEYRKGFIKTCTAKNN